MKLALALLALAATLPLDASAQQYEWGEHAPLEAGANITPDWGTPQAFVFTLSRFSKVTSSAAFHNLYGPPGPEVGNVVLFLRAPRRAIVIGSYDFSGDSGPTHTFDSLVAGTYYYYVTSLGSNHAGSYYSLASSATWQAAPVPEPATLALMLAGLGLVGLRLRRPSPRRGR